MENSKLEAVFSSFRDEVYVFHDDILLFSLQGEQLEAIPEDILDDKDKLTEWVRDEYHLEIHDLIYQ